MGNKTSSTKEEPSYYNEDRWTFHNTVATNDWHQRPEATKVIAAGWRQYELAKAFKVQQDNKYTGAKPSDYGKYSNMLYKYNP